MLAVPSTVDAVPPQNHAVGYWYAQLMVAGLQVVIMIRHLMILHLMILHPMILCSCKQIQTMQWQPLEDYLWLHIAVV